MTINDLRELVAQLVEHLDGLYEEIIDAGVGYIPDEAKELIARAWDALDESKGSHQRPSKNELENLLYYGFTTSTGHGTREDYVGFALAVLDRWGNNNDGTPISVSDRLPEEKDCMVHPRTKLGNWCWGFERCEVSLARPAKWRLMHMETVELEASHWLPHYALSIPQDTEQP